MQLLGMAKPQSCIRLDILILPSKLPAFHDSLEQLQGTTQPAIATAVHPVVSQCPLHDLALLVLDRWAGVSVFWLLCTQTKT
eukprot:221296-Pelagomonas_calceolata.AAC.2